MPATKQDMSKTCGTGYQDMIVKENNNEITKGEFKKWYNEHCANCKYMCEICMYGEE